VLGRQHRQLEAELVELPSFLLDLSRLSLVGRDEHRLTDVPQVDRDLFIERRYPCAGVNYPDDRLSLVYRKARLLEDIRGDDRIVVGHDAAGIDEIESFRLPFDLSVDTVARNARLVTDDRLARLR